MCWVMPPASPAATSVWRMASSSDVLPWSTWPMIVTTGGRSTRSSAASSNAGSCSSASAARTTSTSLPSASARTEIASSDRVWVRVTISPMPMSCLLTQRRRLLGQDVAAAPAAPARTLLRASGTAAGTAGTATRPAARGLRVDDDAAGAATGAALVAQAAAVRATARGRGLRLRLVARRALLGLGRGDDLRAGAGGGRALGRRDARAGRLAAAGLRPVLALRAAARVGRHRGLARGGGGRARRRDGLRGGLALLPRLRGRLPLLRRGLPRLRPGRGGRTGLPRLGGLGGRRLTRLRLRRLG